MILVYLFVSRCEYTGALFVCVFAYVCVRACACVSVCVYV